VAQLDDLLEFVGAEGRVCPQPLAWDKLWKMLPDRRREGGIWVPWIPLILGAWNHTSDEEKAERLAYHIRWAAEHGMLTEVDAYLRSLPHEEWYR
jgi:hypothetical protein